MYSILYMYIYIVYCGTLDGVEAPPVLNMCLRYQQHLTEVACVIANAQVRNNGTTYHVAGNMVVF